MARDQDEKFATAVFHAFCPDAAIKVLHSFFAECQAKTSSALSSSRGVASLNVAFKDTSQFSGRYPVAVITDTDESIRFRDRKNIRKYSIVRSLDAVKLTLLNAAA